METLFRIDCLFLIPAALIGLAAAIVLLCRRRKKNGVRPPHARGYLIAAVLLILFALIALAVIPLLYFAMLLWKFGPALFYSGLKSL